MKCSHVLGGATSAQDADGSSERGGGEEDATIGRRKAGKDRFTVVA